jgi:hypothetical protein
MPQWLQTPPDEIVYAGVEYSIFQIQILSGEQTHSGVMIEL